MDINQVISKIPTLLASICENIIVIKDDTSEVYYVKYTGKVLRITDTISIDELKSDYEEYPHLIEDVLNNDEYGEVLVSEGTSREVLFMERSEEVWKYIFMIPVREANILNDRKTLLIADDSKVITNFFTKLFKDNYNIIVARNGKEVITFVEKNRDLISGVFLDLQMPEMSGLEVLDYFAKHDLFKQIPVSIISGEDSADGIAKATNYDIVDMLQKPFSKEAAYNIVNKTLQYGLNNK